MERIGCCHLSGYARFFQTALAYGDNRFREGTTFDTVAELQALDAQLCGLCMAAPSAVELVVRPGFALRFGEHVDVYGKLLDPSTSHSVGSTSPDLGELIFQDLERSKQPFVVRHCEGDGGNPSLPVWVAAEALSFGTLSKAIGYCAITDIVHLMADDLNLRRVEFSSQARSFVALRNACAHISRRWNDVSKDPPELAQQHLTPSKKRRCIDPYSYYHIFVALDLFARAANPTSKLRADVDALMATSDTQTRLAQSPPVLIDGVLWVSRRQPRDGHHQLDLSQKVKDAGPELPRLKV